MTASDPNFDAYVLKIHAVLEQLDYYRLLGLEPSASVDAIKEAFHKIAAKFHPDRNRDADPRVKKALYDIFKRLNEAYRILVDDGRRKQYNEGLQAGKVRLVQDGRKNTGPVSPEDTIKNLQARKFYVQAMDELKKGNLMNATLHSQVAAQHEPNAKVIRELLAAIKQAKAEAKKK